ncbi:MAG TPA: ferredoxin [candidate division Zixibacteria bacterium]|nr:ferredoxin [candidate division Zixibacteria bacterium]
MKIRIDEETCIACGICSQMCPEAFEAREEDGIAVVIASEEELDNIECVQEAIDNCPTGAIIVEE